MSYLTEEQAVEKWCPQARLGEVGASYNRTGPAANLQCIGSACMMWRWQVRTLDTKPAWGDIGYCGLAGNPG